MVTAVIPDPQVDSRKEAMRRRPYGMMFPLLLHSGFGCSSQHDASIKPHAVKADSDTGWASLSPGSTRTLYGQFGTTWASKSM